LKELLEQNNQNSITHLLEIYLASICSKNSHLFDVILDQLDISKNHKPQAIQSIISVTFLAYQKNEEFREKTLGIIHKIFPHIMGQNFATRFIAQFVVGKLIERLPDDSDLRSFGLTTNQVLNQESAKKCIDLTILECDLDDLLSIEAVYCYIPKISNDDEFCDSEKLQKYFKKTSNKTSDKFQNYKKNVVSNIVSQEFEIQPCSCKSNNTNFQQKYQISYKQLLPDSNFLEQEKSGNSELIVVCSLVSRAPNLGGLARTGEVFGIKEIVLDSISRIKNFEFQALR
jgi:hypothetical protein